MEHLTDPSTDPQIAALEAVCGHRHARLCADALLAGLSHAAAERWAADAVARYLRNWIAEHASETGAHPDHQRRTERRREFAATLLEGYDAVL